MAFAANPRAPTEIIDLVSDDSDGESPVMEPRRPNELHQLDDVDYMALYSTPPGSPRAAMLQEGLNAAFPQNHQAQGGIYVEIDGENIFIPDEVDELIRNAAAPPLLPPVNANTLRDHEIAMGLQQPEDPFGHLQAVNAPQDENIARDREVALALDNQAVTADTCLQRVLEIFPDISHEHVVKLYNDFGHEGDYETLPGQARLDNIIEQLVSAPSYPKQEKGKLKRKREPSIDENDAKKWERQDRVPVPNYLLAQLRSMLKAEFPDIPKQYISDTLKIHQHFYQAYVALAKAKDNKTGTAWKGRPSSNADANMIAMNSGWPELVQELNAARFKIQQQRAERAADDARNQAEKQNLEWAIAAGDTSECSACFDDLPMNRQIHCNGPVAHFTCYDCVLTYIKTEVGESRCRVLCTAGCGAAFANDQLNKLSDKQLLEKLAQLQQEKDIRDAGLDDLEECPFCDYKAILPPIEEDFEFRCANPECEKVSCRRCKSVSHIPISCEQHAKDNKVNSRHKIEEAMTAALIRSCNQCKKQFIKDFGCNKMRCPSCGNMQCYVCSTSLKDYNHFDQGPSGHNQGSGKCPLYDNVEERHEREVKEAEAAARAQVVSENPDVSLEDLEIKVSDAVKKATADRVRQGGGVGGVAGIVGGMMGAIDGVQDQLFLLEAQNAMARRQVAAAERVRQQAARREALQARRRAREDLGRRLTPQEQQEMVRGLQAQQMQRAQGLPPQAAQAPARAGGLFGPVQGYIPVLWNPPPAAPAPQGPQGAVAAPQLPPPQQPQQQPQQGIFGVRGRQFFDFGNPFNFGGDGAADYNQPPQLQAQHPAPAHIQNNNNPAIVGAMPARPHPHNVQAPGAWPNPNDGAQAENDWQQQLRILELENMRRLHDQRLEQRQQADRIQQQNAWRTQQENGLRMQQLQQHQQQNADRMHTQMNGNGNMNDNQQVHPAYRDYEQEMRQMGFQPGR